MSGLLPSGVASGRKASLGLGLPLQHKDSHRPAILGAVLFLHLLVGMGLLGDRHDVTHPSQEPVTAPIALFPVHGGDDQGQPQFDLAPRQAPPRLPIPSPISISTPDAAEQGPDWDESAKRSAAHVAAGTSESSSALSPGRAPKPFGWDDSRTKRWEEAATGGTLVRLNDHCEIVFNPLPVGGCALGKIEPRGDLFEDMRESLDSGDARSSAPAVEPRVGGVRSKPVQAPPNDTASGFASGR